MEDVFRTDPFQDSFVFEKVEFADQLVADRHASADRFEWIQEDQLVEIEGGDPE
jgi:hypothetical protein